MKDKIIKLINVNASVGTRAKTIIVVSPPLSKKDSMVKITSSAKPFRVKSRRCSGCSRKRKRG